MSNHKKQLALNTFGKSLFWIYMDPHVFDELLALVEELDLEFVPNSLNNVPTMPLRGRDYVIRR